MIYTWNALWHIEAFEKRVTIFAKWSSCMELIYILRYNGNLFRTAQLRVRWYWLRTWFGDELMLTQISDNLKRLASVHAWKRQSITYRGNRQISDISHTKSQTLNVSCLVLQLSLSDPLKPGIKSRMKMYLEQRRQAMLQLHLSDKHSGWVLY